MIDLLIPVLGRPERAEPLIRSIEEATSVEWKVTFLVSPGDLPKQRACEALAGERVAVVICPFARADGDYARKINHGFALTDHPWLFQGADDLRFESEWDVRALACAAATAGTCVVGTNDLGNPMVQRGRLSTHSLISREYVETEGASLDGPGSVMHEGYRHNFVDEEVTAVARHRGVFAFARDSVVEHLHPLWSKGPMDATYELGVAGFQEDRKLFVQRRGRLGSRRRSRLT